MAHCDARKKEKQCGNNTYEWESLWVSWACLDQKLIPPAVESLKTLGVVHIVDQDTAVGSTVEGDSQRLEPFLACSIPNLTPPNQLLPLTTIVLGSPGPYLHCYQSVVDENFLCEEIGSNGSFVASTELLIDLFISRICVLAVIVFITDRGTAAEHMLGPRLNGHIGSSNLFFPHRCHQG